MRRNQPQRPKHGRAEQAVFLRTPLHAAPVSRDYAGPFHIANWCHACIRIKHTHCRKHQSNGVFFFLGIRTAITPPQTWLYVEHLLPEIVVFFMVSIYFCSLFLVSSSLALFTVFIFFFWFSYFLCLFYVCIYFICLLYSLFRFCSVSNS